MPPGVFYAAAGLGPPGGRMGPPGILAGPPVSKVGSAAGLVCARLPASPLFSVSGREPRAENFGLGGPPAGMVRAHLSASPLFSVSGREPRTGFFGIGGPPAGFFKVRFAPPSSRTLTASFRGANSSHKSRAAGRGRPPFPRRGLLPPAREPLKFRSGEQILHIDSAPPPSAGRLFQGAVCSPLLANPSGSASGSKFFT